MYAAPLPITQVLTSLQFFGYGYEVEESLSQF